MEWIITLLYILGIFITHFIIYKASEEEIDHNAANIACAAWPVTLLIYILLRVERGLNSLLDN